MVITRQSPRTLPTRRPFRHTSRRADGFHSRVIANAKGEEGIRRARATRTKANLEASFTGLAKVASYAFGSAPKP